MVEETPKYTESAPKTLAIGHKDAEDPTPLFQAELIPQRSLSLSGFYMTIGLLAGFCGLIGLIFFFAGAWPVIGFLGLDVALVFFAFRASYRHGRLREHVVLEPGLLRLERHWPNGRIQSWRLQPYWTRLSLEGDPQEPTKLMITCKDQTVLFGGFLAPDERASFTKELQEALLSARLPSSMQPSHSFSRS